MQSHLQWDCKNICGHAPPRGANVAARVYGELQKLALATNLERHNQV